MRSIALHNLRVVALVVAVFALSACAGTPMKGYTGPVLPADQTAVVRSGAYTDLIAYDGVKIPGLSVAVLPGPHTIEFKPTTQGDNYPYQAYYIYARNTGSVAFTADAGHRYQAYIDIAPGPDTEEGFSTSTGYIWIGYIKDETTGKRLGQTERLRLEVEPRGFPTGASMNWH